MFIVMYMNKLLTISKDPSIKVKSTISEYLSPKEVYLPIKKEAKLLVKAKNVKKGMALFELNEKTTYSPISGEIKAIELHLNEKNEEELFLKIKNDFMEEDNYEGVKNTTMILTKDILERLHENKSLKNMNIGKKKVLILNGIEDEPYLANKVFLHKYHKDEILLLLDSIASLYHIEEIRIYLKENDRESIEALDQILNTYPNMCLYILPDIYPLGNPKFFSKYLKLTDECFVITSEEVYNLYYETVKERQKDFIYITLTGDAIENPQVVKLKIGTNGKELSSLLRWKQKDHVVLINSVLNGIETKLENIYLNENIKAIYFMLPQENKEQKCIHCGKCNQVCPMKCNPYLSVLSKGKIKNKDCLHCGLCSFVCPSYISIEKFLTESAYEK